MLYVTRRCRRRVLVGRRRRFFFFFIINIGTPQSASTRILVFYTHALHRRTSSVNQSVRIIGRRRFSSHYYYYYNIIFVFRTDGSARVCVSKCVRVLASSRVPNSAREILVLRASNAFPDRFSRSPSAAAAYRARHVLTSNIKSKHK